jgi:uncharacterized protein (TIGR03435 family)
MENDYMWNKQLPRVCGALVLAAFSLSAQTPAGGPVFEVASIKPSEPITPQMIQSGKLHVGMKIDGARVDIGNFTLGQLIAKAYDIKNYQLQGPNWMLPTAQRFDIVANLPPGATKEQVPQMLQALLAERFKLEVHKETKEQKVYAMVVGKGGIKMTETAAPAAAPDDPSAPKPGVTGSSSVAVNVSKSGGSEVSTGTGLRQKVTPSPDGKSVRFEISKASMSLLSEGLTPLVDRPILDMTELKGDYDLSFELPMADVIAAQRAAGANVPQAAPGSEAADPVGSIYTAIQSLGLKLEPRKMPLTMIVVDKVEKMPTDN